MDHLDRDSSDETGTSAVTTLPDEDSSEDLFDTLANTTSTNQESTNQESSNQESSNQESSTYPSDIFENTYSSSTLLADQSCSTSNENDRFFSLDDTPEGSSLSQETTLTLTTLERGARAEGVSTSSSLFDDLLDFSSARTSEIDQILLDNTTDPKPVPTVDLLFGVDGDLASPTGFQSEAKAKAPDILDFFDVPYDLPEITSMDATDDLACESLTDGWDLLTDVSSAKPGLVQSPDVVVTFAGPDTARDTTDDDVSITEQQEDSTDGAVEDKHSDIEKHPESADDAKRATDGDVQEKTLDIHHDSSETDTDKMKDSFQDMDFSVLELPGASNLNFDHFKHKRNISQKGSIANRKKPRRSAMQPAGEDSIFLDSTEPKQQKVQNEDIPDNELSLHHNKGDKAQEMDGQISQETSPTRKLAGGIKIPGLLEGLSKSKVFTRAEKTSPVAEPESKPEGTPELVSVNNSTSNKVKLPTDFIAVTSPAVDSSTVTSPAVTISTVISPAATVSTVTSPAVTTPSIATSAVTSPAVDFPAVSFPAVTSSPPLIRPKPVVLPRVLPKPDTKTLKESQNQATATAIVARASSFKNTSLASGNVDKPSFLASPVALSRSASVKVANTAANKSVELSSVKEEKSPSVPVSKLIPPKPEPKKPLSPSNLRSVNKTPPPVPVKPSVAPKPNRASLGWSASFSGGKSPLLPALQSETKTESAINKEHKPESSFIVSAEKKSDSTTNTASTEKKYVPDNKPVLSGFSNQRKPFSFAPKNKEVSHSKAASENIDATVNSALEKTDPAVEIVKSASGKDDASKNAIINRIPSVRASLPTGFVARTGFRASENYAQLEAKKADNLDADDVFDANAEKTVSSVNIADPSNLGDKIGNENNGDEILPRRKSSISGVTPVKSPLTSDKFPATVMPRKGSITGSAYNPIGFRSTLGSSDSDQRSRNSSVSSSVEGVVLGTDSTNLQSLVTAPSPKPRADSYTSSESQKSRNGSFITTAVEQVKSSPDKILEGGPEKTKSDTLAETKLISGILSNKGDEKKKDVIETKSNMQKPSRTLLESPSPGRLNGSTAASKVSDKSTSPWNIQLKKVDKKESPKLEPAVNTNDSQPANWRQQLSVKQKSSVPPKITEKPKQDNTPEWAKASIKRRQRLIDSGVIRGDS